MAPELIRRTRQLLPNLELAQVYGLSATGFFTGLQDQEHTEDRLTSWGKPGPGIELQVLDESGKQIEAGSPTCTRSAPDQEVAPAATPISFVPHPLCDRNRVGCHETVTPSMASDGNSQTKREE